MSSKKRKIEIPRYMRKMIAGLKDQQLTPGLHIVRVDHEPGCSIFKTGICNCNPDVNLEAFPGKN